MVQYFSNEGNSEGEVSSPLHISQVLFPDFYLEFPAIPQAYFKIEDDRLVCLHFFIPFSKINSFQVIPSTVYNYTLFSVLVKYFP